MSCLNVLVTGATGFVGRYMVRELLARGFKVSSFVRPGDGIDVLAGVDAKVVRGDICDYEAVERAVASVDAVVHLASVLGNPDPKVNFEINLGGTKNVVDACKTCGVERVIGFSSISAGRENTSAYGRSKKEAEDLLLSSGLNATVLRTEMMYGHGSRGLHKIIRQVSAYPLVIPMVGLGDIMRQPVYVRDVVRLTAEILPRQKSWRRMFEVAGKDRIKLRDLVRMIANELGIHKKIFPIPVFASLWIARIAERVFPIPPFTYDNMLGLTVSTEMNVGLTMSELGFEPTPIEQGVKISINEIKANRI